MSQDTAGQGAPGGVEFGEVRRRMGGMPQQGGAGPRPVQPGGATPRPPGLPSTVGSPVQQPGSGGIGVAPNPYNQPTVLTAQPKSTPQGGTDSTGPGGPASSTLNTEKWAQPAATPVKPGAPIGPAPAAPPQVSQTEMTGKPAGGQFSPPTPQNPSPNGPSRMQPGSAIKPVVGAPQGGGNQQPNWGLPQAASRFQRADRNPPQAPQSNMPTNPYNDQTGKPAYGAGGAPQQQGGIVGKPADPGSMGGPGQPRRSVYGDQPGGAGGAGGVSV